jgi:hypothetical protein
MITISVPCYFKEKYLDLRELRWLDIGEDFLMSFVVYRLTSHRVSYY